MSPAVPNIVEFSLSRVCVLPHLCRFRPYELLRYSTNLAHIGQIVMFVLWSLACRVSSRFSADLPVAAESR